MQVVNDAAVTTTRMQRPLGVLRGACSQLPFHEQILDEAFEEHDDKLCVPRQLAVLLKMSLQDTCAAFDNICTDGWRLRRVTPRRGLRVRQVLWVSLLLLGWWPDTGDLPAGT